MEFPKFKNEFHLPGIELLPHRDPFLFVDELIAADETGALGRYTFTDAATAIPGKAVNSFFEGHFPGYPVVPGVILVETMAQTAGAGIVARRFMGDASDNASFLLAKIGSVRFRHQVRPGDTLYTVAMNLKIRTGGGSGLGVFGLKGYVNDELAALVPRAGKLDDRQRARHRGRRRHARVASFSARHVAGGRLAPVVHRAPPGPQRPCEDALHD